MFAERQQQGATAAISEILKKTGIDTVDNLVAARPPDSARSLPDQQLMPESNPAHRRTSTAAPVGGGSVRDPRLGRPAHVQYYVNRGIPKSCQGVWIWDEKDPDIGAEWGEGFVLARSGKTKT